MDTLMVGPLGATALAAAGLAFALHMAGVYFATGILLGMTPLVSQAFGAGDRPHCRRVLVQGVLLAGALVLPVAWFNWEGERIALLLGQEPAVAELAGGYMRALAWGVPALLGFMACRQFLEGMGITVPAMVMTFLGLAVNFAGNRVLIYGWREVPALGVVGAGWSTTLVRWAMLAAMILYLTRNPRLHPLRGVRWRPDPPLLRRILGLGVPIGTQLGLEVGLFSFTAVMMGWFGATALGAHQVTINIASTTFMVALGVSLAGSIRVGQHLGAGSRAGARRATGLTYGFALAFMAVCALAFLLVPEWLIGLYTSDPGIFRLGSALLGVAALFQLFDGAQVAGLCALRGAADTRTPTAIAALAYWGIGVPTAYGLGFHSPLGPVGVWAGLCLALATAALLLALRVRRVLWARPAHAS